jgi:hypothetical protein
MLRFYLLGVKMKDKNQNNLSGVLGKTFGKIHYRLISTVHEAGRHYLQRYLVSKNS